MSRPNPFCIDEFSYVVQLGTRWSDNDLYGHVNNVVYYSYFDTVANRFLIEQAGLDIHHGQMIGLVVDSGCRYFAPVAFPERLRGALRIAHLGRSSVRYEIAIFREDDPIAVAQGHFVHVFVDRDSRQALPISDPIRAALSRLLIQG